MKHSMTVKKSASAAGKDTLIIALIVKGIDMVSAGQTYPGFGLIVCGFALAAISRYLWGC